MISIEKLTVRYGSAQVLNGVDLVVDGGQVHGLAGRNGAGKTTLLDALYGFVRPSGGAIRFRGEPLRGREVVGYLPAQSFFYPKITGREYLGVFRAGRGFDAAEWNRVFDLPLDWLVETYSLGMRKKLALLGVLSLGRPVLILDEPFNGLDLETNQILTRLFRELADAGHTVLLTSHILASLTTGCDAVHLLSAGRIERTFRVGEFDGIEARLLDGEVAGKLELVRRLVDRGGGESGG